MSPARHSSRVRRIIESETQREHRMTRQARERAERDSQPGYLPEEPIRMREAGAMDWEGYVNGLVGVLRKCCDEIRDLRGRVEEMEKAKC